MKKEDNKNVKKKEINKKENIEKITKEKLEDTVQGLEKELKNKKELTKEEKSKVNKKIFENILIADIVMIFLYLISLGGLNIESKVFITDLKVFSVILIVFTIMQFEYSYRKENINICIHAIESLVLSLITLFSIYIYEIYIKDFHLIIALISYIFAIYYTLKSIIIYIKTNKKIRASKDDISQIIKK